MDLSLNSKLASAYKSNSQIARLLTEAWVKTNSYCPSCGALNIDSYPSNKPVADFFCTNCSEDFELKSKDGVLGSKIIDGAYSKMIERITSVDNPNFFFLTYSKSNLSVNNFMIIPKHFFVPEIIEKRKPLREKAKRAGWIGCNIDLTQIPELGKIFLVKNSIVLKQKAVLNNWNQTLFLRGKSLESKGWTIDVLTCIDKIQSVNFTLSDVYSFEKELKQKHPDNNFVKDKIRQQLQILRDKGIIEFKSKGEYLKTAK